MTRTTLKTYWMAFSALLFTVVSVTAQDHQWAGRTLDNLEWTIHERLVALPAYSVFDTIRFEVQDKTVTLTGQVLSDNFRQKAVRAVGQLDGVAQVVNHIEVLPYSRRDEALRRNVYRAIYEGQTKTSDFRLTPSVHIIVKNGWVSLEGVVGSDEDRAAAHLRAMQVTAHVSDNLRVARDRQ
jgi:osmotically-inducible protein OsmY